ncbi:MAG: hypothetical protein NC394_00760 [Bacteroides sp.]|nr:hypothetical protein [Bacteroides sp.]
MSKKKGKLRQCLSLPYLKLGFDWYLLTNNYNDIGKFNIFFSGVLCKMPIFGFIKGFLHLPLDFPKIFVKKAYFTFLEKI